LPLEARCDGGRLTSDGGLAGLEQTDRALGLCAALAVLIPEGRRAPVRHAVATLVRQRVFQIACGYEEQDEADVLCSDPRFWANQFRLWLHAAAYWLLDTERRWLATRRVARLQVATRRLCLLKIGGRVSQCRDRVRLRLASRHPGHPRWEHLAADCRLYE
jgi:hypothetical protein